MIPKLRALLERRRFSAADPHEEAADVGPPPNGGEASRNSPSLLRSVIDNSAAVIYVKDTEGRYLLVNRRFEELFLISDGAAAGKTDYDLFPPDRAAAFRAFDRRVLAAGTTLEAEEVVPQQDGLHTYISIKCPIRDEAGRICAVCGISIDITARKRAEDRQRAEEEKHRSLYRNMPAMMHSIDREGRLTSVSNLWLETLGYRREEVIGRRSVGFLSPQSRRFAEEEVLRGFFRTGECKDVPYEFVKKNGEIMNVLLSAICERDEAGTVVGSLAVLIDVSARIRAEEMLQRVASIVESTSDAIVSVTPDRIVTSWNRGAEQVYGYRADEIIGRSILLTVPPERIEESNGISARALRGDVINDFETERLRKDGSLVPLSLTLSPVVDAKGAVVGLASIARDITHRKGMEDALRQSEQRFRDFAETASDWLWETGADHRFTFVSEPFRVLEVDRAARLGVRRIDYAEDVQEEPEKWRQHVATLERHEPFRDFVYKSRRRGETGFVSTSGKPRFDPAGRFLGYRGTARDITRAVRAEEALHTSEQRFRDFAETESDWLWETGPDHTMVWMTGRTGSNGVDPKTRIGKRRWEYAIDVEEEPEKWRQHRETLEARLPLRDFVFKILNTRGLERYVSISGKPVFAPDGTFAGYRGVGRDVTDAVLAQRALREGEERLELAIEAGDMGTWDLDLQRNVMHWSPRLADLFGTGDPRVSASFDESLTHIHPDDREAVMQTMAAALLTKNRFRHEFRIHTPDGERWVASHGIVATDHTGKPVRMVGVVRDITARKQAETRQKLLLDELNHRVKNTLLTVQSVAMQMAREARSPELFYRAFKARLIALSKAHDLLTRGAWKGALLQELLKQTVAPYSHEGEPRVSMSGPAVWLKPNVAVGLAMAFQELATNAAKHGALSVPGGRVAVEWRGGPPDSDKLEIRWTESGGPPVAPPRRRGFGSRLLERGLAYEFKAEVRMNFAPSGLECTIRLPL